MVIFLAAMLLYNFFLKSAMLPPATELSASSIGDDLVKLREKLQSVTLDKSLFSSTGYLLLSDFSTTIPAQATGRSNPFDIIGRD